MRISTLADLEFIYEMGVARRELLGLGRSRSAATEVFNFAQSFARR